MVKIIKPEEGPAAGEIFRVDLEGDPPLTFTYVVSGLPPRTLFFKEGNGTVEILVPQRSSGCTLTVHAWDKSSERDQETWVISRSESKR
jgi:hypothetical protein